MPGTDAVLALLYQAFTGNGNTLLNHFSSRIVLGIYFATGVAAYAAVLLGVASALRWVNDATARVTARTLAAVLPLGAVVAAFAGVGMAAANDFDTDEQSVVLAIGIVVIVLLLTLAVGRFVAVHRKRT